MRVMKTYKYKLYDMKQTKRLGETLGLCAQIYNHCIALHRRYYRLCKKHLNKYQLQKHLTKLKKTDRFKSWNEVPSQAIQDITDRIDRSYRLFFQNKKQGKKSSIPHFQKSKSYSSFTTKQAGYKILEGNRIRIADSAYKYWQSRELPDSAQIKTLTVKRTFRGYYIYLVVEEEVYIPNRVATGKSVGFDFGVKKFLVSSDGNDIQIPLFLKQSLKRLGRLSQKFSKSKGKFGSRRSLNKLYEKVSNQRKDLHWKLAHALTNAYDILVFETLDLQSMYKSIQKTINDFAFNQFIGILQYIAKLKGKIVHFVDKWFPSSQLCSDCGYQNKELKDLKIREWKCPCCGSIHNRDINAAINIHREGTSSLSLCASGAIARIPRLQPWE